MKRPLKFYLPLLMILIAMGLASRTISNQLPNWYVMYAGDFLWAMLIFFMYCLVFNLKAKKAFIISIITVYLIEISQLFHPQWLDYLRSIKLFSLILGFAFLWSDIVAYTFGLFFAVIVDKWMPKS
ncbi:MAG: DUF2809 domain-containing protein [Methylococcales bacterium]|nr:DUF2809 domain-containing protein [Methylococcales bacterium]MCK5926058.1 DUF2809 domain-containing protein [Methylococcales bacterium]